MRTPPDLVDLIARQRCLVTHGQARAGGLSRKAIETLLTRGDWVEAQPCTYRLAGAELGWQQDLLAVVLATGRRAVASHETALAVLGVRPAPAVLEVTVAGSALPLLRDVTVHRTRELPSRHTIEIGGLPTTVGARTAVDLTGRLGLLELLDLLDELIGARRASRGQIHRLATELASGRRGVARLARLTAPGAGQDFRSWLERHSAAVFHLAGLPAPRWNHPVHHRGRLLGIVDAWWERPAVVELDGAAFHSSPRQRCADAARDRRMLRAGIPVFRYGYRDVVTRPQQVADEVAEVLGLRARRVDLAALAAALRRRPPGGQKPTRPAG